MKDQHQIYVGPAGWSYKDWEGIVYPAITSPGFDALGFLARWFTVIEINSSFYRPPSIHTVRNWVERVKHQPHFHFTYKLWQGYSHERSSFPTLKDEAMVKSGLDVLLSQQRLGAVLIQFPWSFKNTPENFDWLQKVVHTFRDYNPVVEVRHGSWNTPILFDFLNEAGAGFANIDQPVIGNSIGLTAIGAKRIGYLRLHGRNYKNWFANDADAASRYDYLYNDEELQSIKEVIEQLIEQSPKSYIIFNNHFRGQAIANALQIMFLMDGKPREIPASLMETYPFLKKIAKGVSMEGSQTSLFDRDPG
ncbi:MAG: DUF72 domain-containing protein [candidate division KSB1 bacterium]|nr:DUF72 domain-containing protein [candidate division KSB1 bacterium]MDZ7358673.1 DUF72 domain-containing protein [candidate division KSB1 bacterium]